MHKHILTVCVLLGGAGCVTIDRSTSPSSTVPAAVTYQAADQLRRGASGRQTGKGGGDSMAPVYGENTTLVITPIDFDDLEQGMIVAYRNKEGTRIVHRLELKQGDTWIARGLNNEDYDPEPVTRDNLLGVVYGVFNAAPLVIEPPGS